jgi:hypothetical protein
MRLVALTLCLAAGGCAQAISPPRTSTARPVPDALVVLPGFGYTRAGEDAFRALAPRLAAEGIDLYLPTYVSRKGLYDSRMRLQRFFQDARLERYERVHIFAFIAGGWTLNRIIDDHPLPNLATVIYDRSPYQERAPRIAQDRLPTLTWFRYGSAVGDIARTSYFPLTRPDVRVGLVIETRPTRFVARFAKAADRQGPYQFGCDAFGQRHDDCIYVPLNHSELYPRFAELWPDVRAFIRGRRFTPGADRVLPTGPQRLASR